MYEIDALDCLKIDFKSLIPFPMYHDIAFLNSFDKLASLYQKIDYFKEVRSYEI